MHTHTLVAPHTHKESGSRTHDPPAAHCCRCVCVEGGWRLKIRGRWCEALLWLSRRPSALIALPEERPRRRGYPHRQAAPVPTEHRHTSASSPAAFLTHSHTRIPIHWLSPICVFCCFILTTNFFFSSLTMSTIIIVIIAFYS